MPVITTVEFEEFTVLAEEELAVERYLTFLEVLEEACLTGAEMLEMEAVGIAATEIAAAEAIDAFIVGIFIAIAAIVIYEQLTTETEAQAMRRKKSEERRKRTALCADFGLQVLQQAKLRLREGKYTGEQMETNDTVPRYPRTFKSRA